MKIAHVDVALSQEPFPVSSLIPWGLALSPAELQGGQGQGHDDKNINNKKWIRTDLHVRKAESLEGSILLSSEV